LPLLFCSDCGQPAVGLFDVVYYKVENGKEVEDEVSKIVRGRALCLPHSQTRDHVTPSKAAKPSEERVLPEVPEESANQAAPPT
jgi:hypothetical protein